jgi:4-hydroxy-3-methylbut-2-en-1-yl diphosphate synthase IspG/GcpE
MSVRAYRDIARRKSRKIRVGKVEVGGDAPITVQSMTNTVTADVRGTIARFARWKKPARHRARVVSRRGRDQGAEGDRQGLARADRGRHPFHYKRAIEAAKAGAACLRINPGNIGSAQRVKDVGPRRRRIMAARCASASMPARSKRNCWSATASRAPKRWWKARSITRASSKTTTSPNSRSA